MKRKRSARPAVTIALFPFLAVLICTMGVIIVMLVIVVQQATNRAREDVARAAAPALAPALSPDEIRKRKETLEDLAWQREVLEQQRGERATKLTELRERLSHVDDHARRLRTQAQQLLQQAQDIDEGRQPSAQQAATKQQLAELQKLIAVAEKEAEELKRKVAVAQRWFALLPYDGPNGTRRRPIYIECTEAGIKLQPEGLTLIPDDFNGPLGPGNPLDAALRAKREYLERHGEKALPYPLLVVRPDGIVAYMAARAALKSWDEEFGYELIGADKQLTFGQPDPALSQALDATLRQARRRQAALAAAMPKKYAHEDPLTSFRTNEVMGESPEMALAAGRGIGSAGTPGGAPGGIGSGGAGPGGAGTGNAFGGTGSTTQRGGGGQFTTAGANGSPTNGTGQFASAGTGANNNAGSTGTPNTLRNGGAPAGVSGGTNARGGTSGNAGTTGNATGGQYASGITGGGAGAIGGANAAGSVPLQGTATAGSPAGGSPGSASAANADPSAAGTPNLTFNANAKPQSVRRANNWGLANTAGKTGAVTRPIRVSCLTDRLVVHPETGDLEQPQNVRFQQSDITADEMDRLVAVVQKRMQGWGMAGQNGYWKPILRVEVAPQAEERFAQFQSALQGSGYEVQRKTR